MKTRENLTLQYLSNSESQNTKVFLSVISDDPEILDAARKDGFVVFSGEDYRLPAANEFNDTADCDSPKRNDLPPGDDTAARERHTEPMNDITREELRTTLSAIEERMDGRIERLEKDSERRSDDLRREIRLRERSARREAIALNQAVQAHIQSNDKAVSAALAALERTESEFGKVKQANKEQRYWMAGIGVAIVLGIMGANATIFSGGKAFFDGGKDAIQNQQAVETILKQAQEQTEANRRILDEIRAAQLSGKRS